MRDAPLEAAPLSKIPAALIVTGPNIASQDLLFAQLGDAVVQGEGKSDGGWFVRLRSAEAPNLKATLRKIIHDVTRDVVDAGAGEGQVAVGKDVSDIFPFSFDCLSLGVCVHSCAGVLHDYGTVMGSSCDSPSQLQDWSWWLRGWAHALALFFS